MLAKRKKGRSQRVALLEAFALGHSVANIVLFPPEEFRGGAVPGAREGDKGRRDLKQFVENGRPADGVVGAAAIHRHDRYAGVRVQGSRQNSRQRVGAGVRVERKLVRPGGSVEHRCMGTREGSSSEATQRVAGGDPAHTSPPWFVLGGIRRGRAGWVPGPLLGRVGSLRV